MMTQQLIRISMTLGFIAALPAVALAQQPIELASAQVATSRQASAVQTADPSIEAQWAAAEEALRNGEYRESLKQFEAIAEVQEKNGMNATQTYWKVAEIQNALGNSLRTAQALDRAAREAERFGDIEMEARSLYEAAVAYAAGNQVGRSTQRIRRVQGMLDSPGIGEEVRQQLRDRMGMR